MTTASQRVVRDTVVAAGDHEAGRQALDVPFPGRRQSLVEIVEVEDQVALGRGKQAEVGQVAIAAGLHLDPLTGVGARS